MFRANAARAPSRLAVVDAPNRERFAFGAPLRLTYAELDKRANRLANYLRERGVGPDVLVGVCMERAPEMIVALLGILKAGGGYLPLDPAWPDDRLQFMLADARAPLLLANQKVAELLPQDSDVPVLLLDTQWEQVAACADTKPETPTMPGHLAYVIFTSGSTGKPKGVAISHRSVANFVDHAIQEYDLDPTDRILQFSSVSFDTAVEEIYPCLSVGATLVLRSHEMVGSSRVFLEAIDDWQITVLDLPMAFRDLDDFWLPHTITGASRAQRYVTALDDGRKAALRERLRATLPLAADGSLRLTGRAWAVRGTKRTV